MKIKIILISILIIAIIGCSKEGKTFSTPEIGWTMELIDNWEIESSRNLDKDIKEGIEKIKESGINPNVTGKEIKLITFRKNTISKFQSTIIPFKESYKNEWNDKYPLIKKHIYDIFNAQGVRVDSTSNKETIDGVNFEVFNMKIYQNNKQVMEQNMYRTYLNGYDFIINMTNDRALYKKQMLRVFRKSKFSKIEG
ncbi:hypothetical protein [Aquimarina algiphila]|uniref:Lipoprotein n=1 Tax=Aquimarina algiphila TaxID=2047982 RepID=A0A554VBM4_9FLAO|nr:hypothetical protein [Aquimarina algiphila]TSE03978.1 hypothetical protein FOF46_27950 [Aquimarina algiphila]